MARALDPGRQRGPPGVEQPSRHAIPDKVQRLLRRALDVERDAEGAGIGDVVAERDRGVELGLADLRERAPLLDGLAVEPGHEQERQDVADAVRLEDDLVAPGSRSVGSLAVRAFVAARSPTARPSRSPIADATPSGPSHPPRGPGDPVDLGRRATPGQPCPALFANPS